MENKVIEQTIDGGNRKTVVVLATIGSIATGYIIFEGIKKGVKWVGKKINNGIANAKAKKAAKKEAKAQEE